jgi:hypothetical protein
MLVGEEAAGTSARSALPIDKYGAAGRLAFAYTDYSDPLPGFQLHLVARLNVFSCLYLLHTAPCQHEFTSHGSVDWKRANLACQREDWGPGPARSRTARPKLWTS